QHSRAEIGLDGSDGVHEARLVEDAHGVGLAERGDADEVDPGLVPEHLDRPAECLLTRPEIRAEPDVRERHEGCRARSRSTITAECTTGGSSTTSGLRTRTRTWSTAGKRATTPSATAPARLSSSRCAGPAKTSPTSSTRPR